MSLHSFFPHHYLPQLHVMQPLAIGRSNVFSFDLTPYQSCHTAVHSCTVPGNVWRCVGTKLRWQQQQLNTGHPNCKHRHSSHHLLWLANNTLPTDTATYYNLCSQGLYCILYGSPSREFTCKANLKVTHMLLSFFSIQGIKRQSSEGGMEHGTL